MIPPERIYRELGNFASRKESLLHPSKEGKPLRINKMPDEEEIVKMFKNWRVGKEDTSDHNDKSENKGKQSYLKKDNVESEEVVEIIKDYRTTNKINYIKYQESTFDGSLVDKLKEVKNDKKIGEKRPILESLMKENETEDDEGEFGIGITTQEFTFMMKDEVIEEEEEREVKDEESKASPSKKKSGKKKKKKNNKKN
ncbi:hypothetical protein RhiirA1_493115 [Rhizophagus irregularis]|uniref:Uncharacterized protein n=1 Tax=Rhizophagus irregularis TaxID=588596 RepID=A0A2N0R7R5_9GLOM|nr:hypothetical protein RhiirA1_493115 [Rhizophagus irregularis]